MKIHTDLFMSLFTNVLFPAFGKPRIATLTNFLVPWYKSDALFNAVWSFDINCTSLLTFQIAEQKKDRLKKDMLDWSTHCLILNEIIMPIKLLTHLLRL